VKSDLDGSSEELCLLHLHLVLKLFSFEKPIYLSQVVDANGCIIHTTTKEELNQAKKKQNKGRNRRRYFCYTMFSNNIMQRKSILPLFRKDAVKPMVIRYGMMILRLD
jgi:hypothetical protein